MKELIVKASSFENESRIPIENTGYGEDFSPELKLQNIDKRAKSIAIIMDDIDHPIIPSYNHWVIWNIPVMEIIPSNIPHGKTVDSLSGAKQGRGYGKHRYRGPRPPFNWSHKYQFTLYVLDCMISLPVSSRKNNLLKAMKGHVLQKGFLIGHYR